MKKNKIKPTRKNFDEHLKDMGVPAHELKENGGRVRGQCHYGKWLKNHDPIAYEIEYNEWVRSLS